MRSARFGLLAGGALLLAGAGCRSMEGPPAGQGGSGSSGAGGAAPASPRSSSTDSSVGGGGAGGVSSPGTAGSGDSGRDTGSAPADGARHDAAGDTSALDGAAAGPDAGANNAPFSFFYTSLEGMRRLSGSANGFGGNLTFGMPTGLEGADKICQTLAEGEGFGHKTWKAFLSAVRGPNGQQVDAIDRIGNGPWYDRNGRLIATDKTGLTSGNRPGGDPEAVADLADEKGRGRPSPPDNDTHDAMTGTNRMGRLLTPGSLLNTCQDWTSTSTSTNMRPAVGFGHSWPSTVSGVHWIQAHTGSSCVAGVNLVPGGAGDGSSVGAGGGYGGFYCFALTP